MYDEPHVGLRVLPIGDDAAILQPANQLMHHRVIGAHHRKAIERQVLDKAAERFLHRLEGLEVIEMFGIDKFGGWKKAQAVHFNDGGVFDQIYKPTN